MDWFLYDNGLRRERVKNNSVNAFFFFGTLSLTYILTTTTIYILAKS